MDSTFRILKNGKLTFFAVIFAIVFLFFSTQSVCSLYVSSAYLCTFFSSIITRLIVIGLVVYSAYRSLVCWDVRVTRERVEILNKKTPTQSMNKADINKIMYFEVSNPKWPFRSRTLIFTDGKNRLTVDLLKNNFIELLRKLSEYGYPAVGDLGGNTVSIEKMAMDSKERTFINKSAVIGIMLLLAFSAAMLFLVVYLLLK